MSTSTTYLRGIIHCHSRFSHDSIIPLGAYIHAASRYRLDFIILTDHDSTQGARRLKELAERRYPSLQVPLAAEYLTSHGDVIAAFMDSDIVSREIDAFIAEARGKGALLLLPHPFIGHKDPEKLAEMCDLVETVNCRADAQKNADAVHLADKLRKRAYAGADAHLARSLGNAIVEVENLGSLRESLAHGHIHWQKPMMSPLWEYGVSIFISALKSRDFHKLFILIQRTGKWLLRRR